MDPRKCIPFMAALLFLVISSPVEACRCINFFLQTSICNADSVLKLQFLQPSQRPGDSPTEVQKGYDVHVTEVLKGDETLKTLKFIRTVSGSSCEYKHNPSNYNVDYLIAASNNNGTITVGLCNYIVRWSELTAKQTKGVEGVYLKGCDCKIVSCSSQPCSSDQKTCILGDYEGGDRENQENNQVCVPKTSTECEWKTIE